MELPAVIHIYPRWPNINSLVDAKQHIIPIDYGENDSLTFLLTWA